MDFHAAHCPNDAVLRRLLNGASNGPEYDAFRAHTESCGSCQVRARKLEAIGDPFAMALASQRGADVTQALPSAYDRALAAREHKLRSGDTLGGYRILGQLGSGGMGVVYKAEDTRLQRLVALKVMRPEFAQNKAEQARFVQEARMAASLSPDHIATVYDVGSENDTLYIAMQYLEGESLDARLQTGKPLSWLEQISIAKHVAAGLNAAHAHGLIHRDIKPANLWLERSARVRILDFGLARKVSFSLLTEPGAVLGTPSYMSPEQARGSVLDARSDLFSLGVVMYEMAARALPFEGRDIMELLTALAVSEPIPLAARVPEIPERLAELITKLLQKSPHARPQSTEEVIAALEAVESSVLPVCSPHALSHAARPPLHKKPLPSPTVFGNRAPLMLALVALALTLVAGALLRDKPRKGSNRSADGNASFTHPTSR